MIHTAAVGSFTYNTEKWHCCDSSTGGSELIVDRILVLASLGEALVKDGLPLIRGSQLHGVELHLRVAALRTRLLHLSHRAPGHTTEAQAGKTGMVGQHTQQQHIRSNIASRARSTQRTRRYRDMIIEKEGCIYITLEVNRTPNDWIK